MNIHELKLALDIQKDSEKYLGALLEIAVYPDPGRNPSTDSRGAWEMAYYELKDIARKALGME